MSGNAFVSDYVLLGICFDGARARWGRLAGDGALLGASEYAYGEGIACLAEEAWPAAGLSWLADVRPGDLAEPRDCAGFGWVGWRSVPAVPRSRPWVLS